MRPLAILALLALCACLPGGDGAEEAPTLTVTPAPDGIVPLVEEQIVEDVEDAAPEPAPPAPPPVVKSEAQFDCERRGGRWGSAGRVGSLCYLPQSDANTSCDSADDCDGACLARSRTCSPISPLIGCHEVLNRSGARATQCRTF